MWAQVIAETSAGETTGDGRASGGDVFFASHPAPEEREQSLRGHAAALTRPGQTSGTATYRTRLRGLRATLFDDELRLRRFPKTSVIVQRMLADLPQDPDVHTFAGDLYRLRGDTGDDGRARTAYEQALALPDAPARTWRGYGLVLRRQGDRTAAATAFRHYLASAPDAADRALIESYIGV